MKNEKKERYVYTVQKLFEQYSKVLLMVCNNVSSLQMHEIRKSMVGRGVLLMGKKTLMRRAIKMMIEKHPEKKPCEKLLPLVKGNIGLVFSNGDLSELKELIEKNKKEAPAKQGVKSPSKVVIAAQNTGMEPTKTSFFQALNIQTKITRGTVEILQDFVLLQEGQKVGGSEAALLAMLGMKPFSYGLQCKYVFENGFIYSSNALNIKDEEVMGFFNNAVSNIAGLSVALNYPTEASIAHIMSNAFKDLLAVSMGTNYEFEESKKYKEALKNPQPKPEEKKKDDKPKKDDKKKDDKKDDKKKDDKKKDDKPKDKPKKDDDEDDGMLGGNLFGGDM